MGVTMVQGEREGGRTMREKLELEQEELKVMRGEVEGWVEGGEGVRRRVPAKLVQESMVREEVRGSERMLLLESVKLPLTTI